MDGEAGDEQETAKRNGVLTVGTSDGLCGCGKKGRYFIKDEMACNKHMRCPTYEELSGEVIRIKQALWRIKEIVKETPI